MKARWIGSGIASSVLLLTVGCGGGSDERAATSEGAAAETAETVMVSRASFEPKSSSNVNGSATFTASGGQVELALHVYDLPEGIHAAHIHEVGDCSSDDGKSAGGHWNPTGMDHGAWGTPPHHLGDLGNLEPDAPRHSRQSQILVPVETEGVEVLKMMHVFGYDDAPHGHGHVRFTNVRVPKDNIVLGSGRGFEIAQGRLGPGRIHHCMRSVGVAERALELMCRRALSKEAFGKPIAELGGNYDKIADARINIEMGRLLTLKAAYMMDTVGNKVARSEIAQIKVAVPNIALKVIDDAIQIHGGVGVSQVFPLAKMWSSQRTLRLADGPDEVHRRAVARMELGKYPDKDPIRTDVW